MDVKEATEQRQDFGRKTSELDDRYGKIGISAVAAAVRHQSERRAVQEPRLMPCESD